MSLSFYQSSRRQAQTGPRSGFTLIEMMVVMAIIATMTAIGAGYLKRPQEGQNLNLSLSTTSSLFQSARSLAVTMNTPTKILIFDDPSDSKRYGREIVVIYQDLDPATAQPVWHVQGKPTYLPQGIYFDKVRSTSYTSSDPTQVNTAPVAMNFNFPGDSSLTGPRWLAYEFASNGTCSQAGEPFYLTSARGDSSSPAGLVTSTKNFSGFVLRRMGNAAFLPQSQTFAD